MKHIVALLVALLSLSLPAKAQTLKWRYYINDPNLPLNAGFGQYDFYARADAAGNIAVFFTNIDTLTGVQYGVLWLNRLGKRVHYQVFRASDGFDFPFRDGNPILRVSSSHVLLRLQDANTGETLLRRYSLKGKTVTESDTVLSQFGYNGSFTPEIGDTRTLINENPNGFLTFHYSGDVASPNTYVDSISYYTVK